MATADRDRRGVLCGVEGERTRHQARGFTLIELLVVLTIILLVSAVALPTVIPAISHRQVSEAGRILQGAIVGARDKAIHDGQPSGIRLLPDPAFLTLTATGQVDPTKALAYSRIIPIGLAPEYSEGAVSVRSGAVYSSHVHNPDGAPTNTKAAVPSLVLEEAPSAAGGVPNAPTSWAWNIRVGDRLQLENAGPWYAVAGPQWQPNPEGFVNWGPPGTVSPLNPTGRLPVEWLILVDGRDDNGNGVPDDGWDGIDNDGDGLIDETRCALSTVGEWESEQWQGAAAQGLLSVPYAIRRRPMPQPGAREIALPTAIVIDANSARSRLPVNIESGIVDILVNPDGTAYAPIPYGAPSSFGLGSAFFHFGLLDRGDIGNGANPRSDWSILTLNARTGRVVVTDNPDPLHPFTAAQQGTP